MSEPTNEEQVAREIVGKLAGHDEDNCGLSGWDPGAVCTCSPDESYRLALAILTRFRREAKVEAHEQDARAICEKCGERSGEFYEAEHETSGVKAVWHGAWFHRYRSDRHVTSKCAASAIWDALSALRGEK
jgi:hypothetical protein